MTRIIQGVFKFQRRVFSSKQRLFEQLHGGQRPLALFITCSDSRINPNLLTQTEPGELFVLRNAGNIVPPAGSPPSGEAATIEYAVHQLQIRDVILCGHSQCGAMQGLIQPQATADMPAVTDWLALAGPVVEQARSRLGQASTAQMLGAVIEQNVLMQMQHLQSYPFVRDAAAAGRLRLHAWVYAFERGEVTVYDQQIDRFVPLAESARYKLLVPVSAGEPPPADRSM
jgi:carbonic anhydrase